MEQTSPVIPFLHYADLDACADWMPRVFGFRLASVERYPDARAAMAVFRHGSGLIFARQEDDAAALSGRRVYVYIDDVDAHFAHLRSSDVEASQPTDSPWGDRTYSTRDPQGHPWTFATPIPQAAT